MPGIVYWFRGIVQINCTLNRLFVNLTNQINTMKKHLLTILGILSIVTYAQDFHRCYTQQAMEHVEESNPGYLDRVNEIFERAKLVDGQNRDEVYTIPVVVHIVYDTDEKNLPDSVIYNQIETLNADFRRLNEDAENVRDTFNTIVGDTHIQFALASIDPDGNPTTGITRTETTVESFFDFETIAENVKATSEGGIDPWDQEHYLNIWVCDMSIFGFVNILGYATPPDGLEHWPADATAGLSDGVVVQYQVFGSNNPIPLDIGGTAYDVRGRTLTHEVGHYLGLRHIWGDGDCAAEDGVDDTPNADAQSEQDCDDTKNTCVDDILELGDLPDMIENFMDYSAESCQNSFTLGQIEIMRGVLEIERFELVNGGAEAGIFETSMSGPEFQLYPNPASGPTRLTFQKPGDYTVNVFDETGKQIKTTHINDQTSEIIFNELSAGFYLIRVTSQEGIRTEKLIIQ